MCSSCWFTARGARAVSAVAPVPEGRTSASASASTSPSGFCSSAGFCSPSLSAAVLSAAFSPSGLGSSGSCALGSLKSWGDKKIGHTGFAPNLHAVQLGGLEPTSSVRSTRTDGGAISNVPVRFEVISRTTHNNPQPPPPRRFSETPRFTARQGDFPQRGAGQRLLRRLFPVCAQRDLHLRTVHPGSVSPFPPSSRTLCHKWGNTSDTH